jgi:two-component system, LuxR family, response regulator FixJ
MRLESIGKQSFECMDTKSIVYIIDDDTAFLESLATLVSSMGLQCVAFPCVAKFLEAFDPRRPGCVLLDIHLPDFNGLKLQEHFSKESIPLPVIIVSGTVEVSNAVRAIQQGAIAFLQKSIFSESELWDALQMAIARDAEQRAIQRARNEYTNRLAALTGPEMQVLLLILAGQQHGEITQKLNISRRTVENRRSKLMQKLAVSSLPQLIKFAHEAGIFRIIDDLESPKPR